MKVFISNIESQEFYLNPEESHHLCKVLRAQLQEEIFVTNGKGTLVKARITALNPKKTQVSIVERWDNYNQKNYQLHVAIAPTKSMDRFEFFLEKATELGIDSITPIICQHSERRKLNLPRCRKIVQSATKQSLKAYLPTVNALVTFSDFLASQSNHPNKFMAHCNEDFNRKELKSNLLQEQDFLFLIGPEGDFSAKEIQLAGSQNCHSIALGKERLRTETAGIHLVSILSFLKRV